MSSITIKDVPKETLNQLKQQAIAQRRSLNQQVLFMLEQALKSSAAPRFSDRLAQFWSEVGREEDLSEAFQDVRSPDLGREVEL